MKSVKTILAVVTAVLLGGVSFASAQSVPSTDVVVNRASAPIKGHYIVVFKDEVKDPRAEVASLNRGGMMRVKHVYASAIRGFAAEIPDVVVNALRNNPRVNYIEQDQTVSIDALTTASASSWGLDRLDQAKSSGVKLDGYYRYDYSGSGVTAYIVDTGIYPSHSDFEARASVGADFVGGDGVDCNGHGTHVAGTIGGKTYGVARSVKLVGVRVLGCSGSGSTSGVIAGVDWVKANAKLPAVANMSLGGGSSASLDSAVNNAVAAGVVFAVAAGNSNRDACNFSPARAANALTVGATTSSDSRASYSNFGSCLDIFAPGSSITSTWIGNANATNTISGTSMATPHVAGAAALLLEENASYTTANIQSQLIGDSLADNVANAGRKSPNRLLQATFK